MSSFRAKIPVNNQDVSGVVIDVEDNGPAGVAMGVPLFLAIRYLSPTPTQREQWGFASLTISEARHLANTLMEAIAWATAQRMMGRDV